MSRADSNIKSGLDLLIMSADLAPFLKRIVIDHDKKFAPARARIVNGKKKLIYSDHHPLLVEFENLPKGWIAKEKISSWNLGREDGKGIKSELTEASSERIDNIIENKKLTSDEVAEKGGKS